MAEVILGLIGGALGLTTLILRHLWAKEKTKGEKIIDAAEMVGRRAADIRAKIAEGKVYNVQAEMDDLVRRCRSLRLLKTDSDS